MANSMLEKLKDLHGKYAGWQNKLCQVATVPTAQYAALLITGF